MKRKSVLFILSAFLSLISLTVSGQGFSSLNEATTIAREIVKASGKPSNFMLSEADVPNAMAVLRNGKRYVFYNPTFVNRLAMASGTHWSAVSILAHEIGHHLNKGNKAMATELEADEFSGYILQKMGASLGEAQAAMKLIAHSAPSRTHPARADRLSSIEKGWVNAGGIPSANSSIASAKTQQRESSTGGAVDSRYILADLRFNSDPQTTYFLTTRLNVIKVVRDEVSIIGKLTRHNDADFPFVIADSENNRVFVDKAGSIVNERGRVVGKMMLHDA